MTKSWMAENLHQQNLLLDTFNHHCVNSAHLSKNDILLKLGNL